tara:strand:- start:55 stop:441 length:387 start_codon:yes stop_codon:yes gene_type:complete
MSFTKTINPTEVITLRDKTAKLKPADLKMKGEELVKNTIGASTIAAKEFIPNAMLTGSRGLNRALDKKTLVEAIKIGVKTPTSNQGLVIPIPKFFPGNINRNIAQNPSNSPNVRKRLNFSILVERAII